MAADISWLVERLAGAGAPVVIDGGMGTHLQASGVPMDGKVWSGRAVLSHPDAVRAAHQAFVDAGAEVIITNTFAAARHMLEPGGLGDAVAAINRGAVALAREARERAATRPVAIAGSICEWAPADDPRWREPAAIGDSVREQAELLAEAGVDLIALEMCQRVECSVAAVEAASEVGLPIWIGMSPRRHAPGGELAVFDHPGRAFEPLVAQLARYPAMALNVMHSPVPDIDLAMSVVRRHWDGPIGVYPESGYFTMPDWQFVDIIEPDALVDAARRWVAHGARLVGGCCGLGPAHIGALSRALR